jgi:hypothetical protein
MNLRGGRIKADCSPPKQNKKQQCELMRNSSSMPELNNIHSNSVANIDTYPSDWADEIYDDQELCNEFENNININDKTVLDIDSDDDEDNTSTAKNKSNKSHASEANTDDDADDLSSSEDEVGKPLTLINSTKKNSKGEFGKKLCYEGYYYVVDRDYVKLKNINKVQWKCERVVTTKTTARCGGRVTSKGYNEPVIVTTDHNHIPEPKKKGKLEHLNNIKDLAFKTRDVPRSIIRSASMKLDNAISSLIPSNDALLSTVKRVRKEKAGYGLNPTCLEEINVPDELRYTIVEEGKTPEEFYWDDSLDGKRIMIFTTQKNIDMLCEHRNWYIDGTFDVSPKIYKQMVTIHALINNKVLPLVYALLPDKDGTSYVALYKMLLGYLKRHPKSINIDFELANIKAIKELFPSTKIYGCFFHFTQNMWKHVQCENKVVEFISGAEYYYLFRALQSLAFVPLEHVDFVFDFIKKKFQQFNVTLSYFEKYYLGTKSRTTYQPAVFPREIWSVYERVINDLPRTNNSVEAWHKAFQLCCGSKPGVYKLIQNFREENKLSELARSDIDTGLFISKITNKEIRIYFKCTTFDPKDTEGFLKGMAQNLADD